MIISHASAGHTKHLAPTPPMGWNSFNAFRRNFDEGMVREIADCLVSSGMRDAGYEYLVVDAGWQAPTRDENGRMRAHPGKFPSGIAALVDYAHGNGLKMGMYQTPNVVGCGAEDGPGTATAPGDTFAEKAQFDANTFAKWEIDYLKFDWCGAHQIQPPDMSRLEWRIHVFKVMRDALDATGHDIVYSINPGSGDHEYWADPAHGEWASIGADLWRVSPDVYPCWASRTGPRRFPEGIFDVIDTDAPLAEYAGLPGHWNDPDMLVIGTTEGNADCTSGLTEAEERAHISMWAIMAAPLMAGNDLRAMPARILKTLTNREVIAVDQDPLGVQGTRIRDDGDHDVWVKPLETGDHAVVLLNRGEEGATIKTTAHEIGLERADDYVVRDLWGESTSVMTQEISSFVSPHGAAMFRAQPDTREEAQLDETT